MHLLSHVRHHPHPLILILAGKKFQSATAFSIHCKRMQTPNKQGDDGWKSTLYEGQPLDTFRQKYYQETGLDVDDAEVCCCLCC